MYEPRKDDQSINIRFVKTVKKYPCLYNYNLPKYSRRDVTDKAWMKVAKIMNYTVPHCKEKWRYLRRVFIRKLKPSPSGNSMKSSKPYYLNRFMSFVLPYIKTNHMYDDTPITVPSPDQAEVGNGPASVDFPEQSNQEQRYADSEQTVTIKKQEDKLNEYLQPREGELTRTNDNPREIFLVSLLPEINAMTENQMRVFRRRVLQLIDEISEQTVTIKKQEDKLNEYLQPREGELTRTNDNPREIFLVSLLPEINAMTETQMRVFRRRVLQLIDEISELSDTIE